MKKTNLSAKTILLILISFYLSSSLHAQAPQQFNYQGAARNANGSPIANRNISVRISILDGSPTGLIQYSESRNVTTNSLGLYNLTIGGPGAISSTGSIGTVPWASGIKYIRVEIDINSNANYVLAGVSQLLSVPYALYAANSPAGANGKSAFEIWQSEPGNSGKTIQDYLAGLKGVDGKSLTTGNSDPTNPGRNGDTYINTLTGESFLYSTTTGWTSSGIAIGLKGADGKSMFSGTGAPANSTGKDGDTYLDN
ncbi:MAG: hypothetical protein EOO85_25495, partial [Pedobacter sp.]